MPPTFDLEPRMAPPSAKPAGVSSPSPRRLSWPTVTLVALAVLIAVVVVGVLIFTPPPIGGPPELFTSPVSHFPPAPLAFDPQPLGTGPGYRPLVTNVRVVDLDADGRPDVLACDGRRNRVIWYHSRPDGKFDETPIGDELACPVGTAVVDLDGDGDRDVVVAVLGDIWPTDARVGRVVWLENKGGGVFATRVILDHLRRVSDVQAADLDADGDIDLAVAEYGYDRGCVLWLENKGGGKFADHLLLATQGPSHVPLADLDGDGDIDIAALVSQEHEEIWAFENDGKGGFTPRVLHAFTNFDLGGAGLIADDLNGDGKPDLILSAGDNLEVNGHFPQPWHGVYWLANGGRWKFEIRQAAAVGGVYAAAVADFDGDGDRDVVAACMFNDWRSAGAASLVLLENDGSQRFTATKLADRPIDLATVAAGDLNGDGRPDVVTGCLHLTDPGDRAGRVTLWLNRGKRP